MKYVIVLVVGVVVGGLVMLVALTTEPVLPGWTHTGALVGAGLMGLGAVMVGVVFAVGFGVKVGRILTRR